MPPTMNRQVPLRSSVGIGEAARRVGLAASAVRYYESEGLLDAAPRVGDRRRYGPDALRRLAFIAMSRELGLSLSAIRAALRPEPGGWARLVDEQVALLDATIARAKQARGILLAGRDCPAAEPVRDCPHLHDALDALVRGEGSTTR